MSSDFTKILVKDDRMDCVDNIKYMVLKGGQNVTPSQFGAISKSNNQIVFNIQVPSEQTLIDRRVLLQTDLQLVVTSTLSISSGGAGGAAASPPGNGCGYGLIAGLSAYPLHSMMTVASATINNNTVSINMKDVLPAIVRMLDKKELGSYNGMSATATDSLLNYGDQVYGDSPASGSRNILDTDYVGRGSLVLLNYSSSTNGAVVTEVFTWRISEPLMISPFIYCNPKSNGQAFYGIQNMNIVLNIGSDLQRVFRGCGPPIGVAATGTGASTPAGYSWPSPSGYGLQTVFNSLPFITGVTAGNLNNNCMFDNTYLLFTFLTAHPSDLFPSRNICPYYELPRYITQSTIPSSAAPVGPKQATATGTTKNLALVSLNSGGGYTGGTWSNQTGTLLTSQTLQLNQIPDKLIIFIRKANQTWYDSDSYLPISGISIDFNNNSGILSAARSEDLYRMSKDNGSNQSWNEWSGFQTANVAQDATDGILRPCWLCPPDTVSRELSPQFSTIPTCGGVLMLEFGKDIQLIEDFFAAGSLGNFNIRVNVRYNNNNMSLPVGSTIELVMITMNSGVFVCERGTSSTYTGILTRADVLEASEQDPYTRSDVKRMVGGGFLDMLKSGVHKLAPLAKAVAPHVARELSKHGSGVSGGGGSGGRLSGRYQ